MQKPWVCLTVWATFAAIILDLSPCDAYWAIYNPADSNTLDKSVGSYNCGGLADVAGMVKIKLLASNNAVQDSADGTAAGTPPNNCTWNVTLNNAANWTVDSSTSRHTCQLLDANSVVQHTTSPKVVP